jgi:hypothetical protein
MTAKNRPPRRFLAWEFAAGKLRPACPGQAGNGNSALHGAVLMGARPFYAAASLKCAVANQKFAVANVKFAGKFPKFASANQKFAGKFLKFASPNLKFAGAKSEFAAPISASFNLKGENYERERQDP